MELLDTVRTAWGFMGLIPRSIVEANAFGNLLVEDATGRVWRICPEELSCKPVASSSHELQGLRESADFGKDWTMESLVLLATSVLGVPTDGRCFCLKIPAVLGGGYERDNLATITLSELIAASGDMAFQIKDLPDGANVALSKSSNSEHDELERCSILKTIYYPFQANSLSSGLIFIILPSVNLTSPRETLYWKNLC